MVSRYFLRSGKISWNENQEIFLAVQGVPQKGVVMMTAFVNEVSSYARRFERMKIGYSGAGRARITLERLLWGLPLEGKIAALAVFNVSEKETWRGWRTSVQMNKNWTEENILKVIQNFRDVHDGVNVRLCPALSSYSTTERTNHYPALSGIWMTAEGELRF